MKTDLFQSYDHCCFFQIFWHIGCSPLIASPFRIWSSSTGIPSLPLALFIVMLPKAYLTSDALCLALGEWSHHRGYLVHEDMFCIVILCILVTSSSYLLLLLGLYHIRPLLCSSLHEFFPWYLWFSWRDLVFSILLLSSISLHWSLRKAFLFLCYSLELSIQMGISFLLPFAFHFSSFDSYL